MNYVEKLLDGVQSVFNINPSNLSGSIDIVVVRQPDGTFRSTPFHVRFGKFHLLNSTHKRVTLTINGEVSSVSMKLGSAGEATFVQETISPVHQDLSTSPIRLSPLEQITIRTTETIDISGEKVTDLLERGIQIGLSEPIPIMNTYKGETKSASSSPVEIRGMGESSSPVLVGSAPTGRKISGEFPEKNKKEGEGGVGEEEVQYTWWWGSFPVRKYPPPTTSGVESGRLMGQSEPAVTKLDQRARAKSEPRTLGLGETLDGGKQTKKKNHPSRYQWDFSVGRFLGSMFGRNTAGVRPPGTRPTAVVTTVATATAGGEASIMVQAEGKGLRQSGFHDEDSSDDQTTTEYYSENEEMSDDEIFNFEAPTSAGRSTQTVLPLETVREVIVATEEKEGVATIIQNSFVEKQETAITTQAELIVPQQEEKKPKEEPKEIVPPRPKPDPPLLPSHHKRFHIELSKCGNSIYDPDFDKSKMAEVFDENKLTYEDLVRLLGQDTGGLFDAEVVFRIHGKYYPWPVAGPIMVSLLAFGKNLSPEVLHTLLVENNLEDSTETGTKTKEQEKWYDYFFMKKEPASPPSQSQSPPTQGQLALDTVQPVIKSSSSPENKPKTPLTEEPVITVSSLVEDVLNETPSVGVYYTRSLRPTSEQLAAMNLQPGPNKVTFSVTSGLLGKQEVTSTIYLWERDDSIVISDIDGTITKSDVFGQILPVLFGRDWSQEGVAQLYTSIAANGYKVLYLTARAIGQAGLTREFLNSLSQDVDLTRGKQVRLPDGPVFMSPDRLLYSLNREVILRNPGMFKVACLHDIKLLFEPKNPFYAGFGNRHSDALSYKETGIPEAKIFIINHYGEVSCSSGAYSKTYTKLMELVDEMFPPLNPKDVRSEPEWNEWKYWKSDRVMKDLEDIEKELLS